MDQFAVLLRQHAASPPRGHVGCVGTMTKLAPGVRRFVGSIPQQAADALAAGGGDRALRELAHVLELIPMVADQAHCPHSWRALEPQHSLLPTRVRARARVVFRGRLRARTPAH